MQTPILWSHGTDDRMVLFEAGQAALPFLKEAGVSCEFKVYSNQNSFSRQMHDRTPMYNYLYF